MLINGCCPPSLHDKSKEDHTLGQKHLPRLCCGWAWHFLSMSLSVLSHHAHMTVPAPPASEAAMASQHRDGQGRAWKHEVLPVGRWVPDVLLFPFPLPPMRQQISAWDTSLPKTGEFPGPTCEKCEPLLRDYQCGQ